MPLSGPARVLVMVEQPLIADVIKLTLNHGIYVTREGQDVAEAMAALGEWHSHLAVIDMDIGGDRLLQQMARSDGLQNDWRKPRFIATVPGRGYRFIPAFSDSEPASEAIRSTGA